jgi:DNA-binding NarL/FixJ family response regulator
VAIPVLLLEPDQWRFRGMQSVLENGAAIEVVGEPDYARILTIENGADDREPRVAVIAQRLLADFGLSVIPHVKDLFPGCAVLIDGEHESNDATASIIVAGGSGFFALNAAEPRFDRDFGDLQARGDLLVGEPFVEHFE